MKEERKQGMNENRGRDRVKKQRNEESNE